MRIARRLPFLIVLLGLAALPWSVHACTVCFGGDDANLIRGFTWGIWILLVLPYTLGAGLVLLIIRGSKRARKRQAAA